MFGQLHDVTCGYCKMDVPNMEDNGGVSKCAQVYDNASCLSATRRSRHSRHSTKTNAPRGSGSHVSLQHLFRSFNVGCWRDSTRHRWKTWCSHLTHQFWTTITPGSVVTSISCSADPKKSEIDSLRIWCLCALCLRRVPWNFKLGDTRSAQYLFADCKQHLTSSIFSCHDAESYISVPCGPMWPVTAMFIHIPLPSKKLLLPMFISCHLVIFPTFYVSHLSTRFL